jgi:hypothetical protein
MRAWLIRTFREPLVQFALVGVALFAAERGLRGDADAPEPREIRVTEKMSGELVESFRHRHGRDPTDAELERLVQRWVEDEVLYREGLALGLASDDVLIKNRVIEKVRFVLSNAANVREPSEEELRAWLNQHRAAYDRPRRYDFEHVSVSEESPKGAPRASVRLLERLSAGLAPESLGAGFRRYEGRSAENVAAIFGGDVEARLAALPIGSWQLVEMDPAKAPAAAGPVLPASAGPAAPRRLEHLFRVVRVENPPDFEGLRAELAADWKRHQQELATRERLEQMRAGYAVHRGGP